MRSASHFESGAAFHKMALAMAAGAWMLSLNPATTCAQDARSSASDEAPDLSLEELVNIKVDSVFSASRYSQKVTQAPASVSIVTADEIKKFGYRSLADILGSMRGFYVPNDRTYSYLGSRGFQRPGDYNTRYLLQLDGHRLNDNIYDSGFLGTEGVLDVDLIDRIEVIRGPSSSIYGNSAFFGVINIITKTPSQIEGVEASVEGGTFDAFKGRFSFGKKFENELELVLSGSYFSSDGDDSLYYSEFDQRRSNNPQAGNDGLAQGIDGEELHQFYTSLSWHDFSFSALYSSRTKDSPTAPYGTIFGAPTTSKDERAYAELKYHHEFENGTNVIGRLSYDSYAFEGLYNYGVVGAKRPRDITTNIDRADGDWVTTELQLKRRFFDRHTILFGTEYRENLRQDLLNYDDRSQPYLKDRRHGRTYGAYTQAEVTLRKNLLLNTGLRYDYYDTFGGTLNPRFGLIFSPSEGSTLKLLYGQAYRAPNDYELHYGAPGFGQASNPRLQPETIRTYELVYEQYLPASLRFSASGYHYDIHDLISQDINADDDLVFNNIDQMRANGLEFELEGKYSGGVLARASYAIQRTEDAKSGEELTSSPRHILKGNLSFPLYEDIIFAALELQCQSSVGTLAGNRSGGFLIGNFTLFSREVFKGLEASASIYNLFDTRYETVGSRDLSQDTLQGYGRSFRVKLTYKF